MGARRKQVSAKNDTKMDTEALTVIIKHTKTDRVVVEEKVGSIIFASVIGSNEHGQEFNAGIAGEVSINSLVQSVEAVCNAAVLALKETHDIDAEDFMNIMGNVLTRTIQRNFSEEETMSAILNKFNEMSGKSKKNNTTAH